MEPRPVTPSVIAKIMGLDKSPQQQPVQKRMRVLSENYFRRVATIGVREKCHSLSLVVDRREDFYEVGSTQKDTQYKLLVDKGTTNSGWSEAKVEVARQPKFQVSPDIKECEDECIPEDACLYGLHKFLGSPFESNETGFSTRTNIVVLKPKHGSATCFPPMTSFEAYHSSDRKWKEFPSPGNEKMHGEVLEPLHKLGSGGSKSIPMLSESAKSLPVSLSYRKNHYQSVCYPDESYVSREFKKKRSEQWKMTETFEEYRVAGKDITLRNLLAIPVHDTGPRKLDHKCGGHFRPREKLIRNELKDLNLSKYRTQQDIYDAICNEWSSRPKRSVNWAHSRSSDYKFNQKDVSRPIKLRSNHNKFQSFHHLEIKGNFMVEKTCVVCKDLENEIEVKDGNVTDTSAQEETFIDSNEESPFPLHCFTSSGCMGSLEEAYQPSPVSVLEPLFRGDNSCTPDSFRGINVDTTEYSDTYAEGSGMIVSSDDDTSEGSVNSHKENNLMGLSSVEESRHFSYLTDVLSEAGFYNRSSEMDIDTWCFQECPMSLYVFENLEKKFGDQGSWTRSDRRLLFDCINAGLMEILQPCMGELTWTRSVCRRIRSQLGQEMIEEDLSKLLVIQEKEGKETRMKLEEKLLGSEMGKLDLRDDIDFIGLEIERLLMDELVAEFVSMESLKYQ